MSGVGRSENGPLRVENQSSGNTACRHMYWSVPIFQKNSVSMASEQNGAGALSDRPRGN